MNEANTNTKFGQLMGMGKYVAGERDDEKAALESLEKAKAKFVKCKDVYDKQVDEEKFFSGEAKSHADAKESVNLKIRENLRKLSPRDDKELITLRAEMREHLEMEGNYFFLAGEISVLLAESREQAEKAAARYRSARAAAIDLIANNMFDAAIGAANDLFLAIYAKVTVLQERRTGEKDWFEMGFDSAESAVIAEVKTRIVNLYRTLDDYYMRQMLPSPIGVPFSVGDLGEGTPASWHKARMVAGTNPATRAA